MRSARRDSPVHANMITSFWDTRLAHSTSSSAPVAASGACPPRWAARGRSFTRWCSAPDARLPIGMCAHALPGLCATGCATARRSALLEPAPCRVTGGRAVRLRHAPGSISCSRCRRTRGRPTGHQRESRPRQALGTGTRPPTARSCCCAHVATVVNERGPKTFAPPAVLRRAGGAILSHRAHRAVPRDSGED